MGGVAMCSNDRNAPVRAVSENGADQALTDELKDVYHVTGVDTSKLRSDGFVAVVVKGGSITEGASAVKDALAALQKFGSSLPYSKAVVRLDEVLVDKYGRESVEPVFSLTYDRADIDKMNFPNLTSWDMLNFAKVESLHAASRHLAMDECVPGSDTAKYAGAFCAVATAY